MALLAFMSTTQQRINRIGDQLSEETQAVSSRVELLDERISKAVQGIERKVEAPALRRLEERMLEMDSWVETKAESSELRKAEESLQALQASVAKAAAAADLEPMRRQIKELQTSKADGTVLDQLLGKERTLTCSLAEKADFAELEQLKIQMHALSGAVAQHMESSTQDQESAQAKLSTLSGALGRCAGAEEMRDSLKDVFAELAKKAETTKLELLTSQVEILSDVLAPKLRRAHPPARPNTGPARPDGAKGRKGHKNECRPEPGTRVHWFRQCLESEFTFKVRELRCDAMTAAYVTHRLLEGIAALASDLAMTPPAHALHFGSEEPASESGNVLSRTPERASVNPAIGQAIPALFLLDRD
ncbi:unnamed protein product [Effrenium voratum]|nr:unnamed protein product [Effrenium voratum]